MSNAMIGALRVSLGLDSAAFSEGLSLAEKKLNGFGKQMGKIGKSMQATGKSLSTYVTAPIVAMGGLTLKVAGDFEASMNRVAAVSGATGEELAGLKNQAKDMGATTQFSASQAADAMGFLAMAGFSVQETMEALPGTLQLAASAQMELGRAADIVSNVLSGYGMEVSELARVNDVLVKAFTASNTNLEQLGEAMKYAGPVASTAGIQFEETAAALGMMGNAGIQASMAGTSLRGAVSRILAPTKQMREAMAAAGLSFTDASGKLLPLADIIEQLEPHAEDAGLFMELFGQRAGPAMAALVSQGSEALREMTRELEESGGTAERIGAVQMQGFNGAMRELTSAFEGLQLAIADSGLIEWATEAVKAVTAWVQAMSKANPELLKWGVIVAAAAAAIGPFVLAIGLTASGLAGLISALPVLGAALLAIVSPIGLVVAAFAAIGAAWFYWDEIKAKFPQFAAVVETAGSAIMTAVQGIMEHMRLQITAITQLLTGDWKGAWESAKQMIQNFGTTLLSVAETLFPQTIAAMRTKAAELLAIFERLPAEMLRIGGQIIDGLWQGLQGKFQEVKDGLAGFASGLVGSVKSTLGIQSPSKVMHEIGVNIMQGLAGGIESHKATVTDVAKGAADELKGSFEGVEQAAGSMFSGLGSSIAGLIKGTKDWRDVLSDVLGQIAQLALSNMGSMGGFGGFLSSLLGGLTGFARGGTIMPGGTGGIDSQLVAFRKSPTERVDITKPGQSLGGGGGGTVTVRGVFVDDNGVISAKVESMGYQAAETGRARAVREVRDSLEGWQVRLGQDGAFA